MRKLKKTGFIASDDATKFSHFGKIHWWQSSYNDFSNIFLYLFAENIARIGLHILCFNRLLLHYQIVYTIINFIIYFAKKFWS